MGAQSSSAYGGQVDEHDAQARRNAMTMDSFMDTLEVVTKGLASSSFVVNGTTSSNVKPTIIPSKYAACTPINLQAMHINTTHRGRVLQGRIVSPRPVVMTSAMVLLEDDLGDYVLVRTSVLPPRILPHVLDGK